MFPIIVSWGGVPARVIGDFDSFVNKRVLESSQCEGSMKPQGEMISASFEKNCWNEFYKMRISTLSRDDMYSVDEVRG